jgi:hypothetical protein
MRKLQIVIDVELEDDVINTDSIKRIWSAYSNYEEMINDPDRQSDIVHEKALLAALKSNPELYKRFVTVELVDRLQHLTYQELHPLAGIDKTASDTLEEAVELLPSESREHFGEAIDADCFFEYTGLVRYLFEPTIKKITVTGDLTPSPK